MTNYKDRLLALAINPATDPSRIKAAVSALEGDISNKQALDWISEKDLIKSLKIARSTLWSWRKLGLPSKKVVGRRFYQLSSVDKFIQGGGK